jgi:hypothetical protein
VRRELNFYIVFRQFLCFKVSRRSLTAEGWFRSQASSYEICGGQSGIGTDLSRSTKVYPVNIIPPVLSVHLHLHVAHFRRTSGRSLGTFELSKDIFEMGVHWTH